MYSVECSTCSHANPCRYKLRLLFDAVDMRWDWPVDVNYHEAKAYCAWRAEQDGSEVMYRIIRCGGSVGEIEEIYINIYGIKMYEYDGHKDIMHLSA